MEVRRSRQAMWDNRGDLAFVASDRGFKRSRWHFFCRLCNKRRFHVGFGDEAVRFSQVVRVDSSAQLETTSAVPTPSSFAALIGMGLMGLVDATATEK